MEFEIRNITNLEYEIISCEQRMYDSFSSDWNDAVHDSFYDYVNFFQSEAKSIIDLINQVPELLGQLKEVNGEKLKQESNNLLSMIEGV